MKGEASAGSQSREAFIEQNIGLVHACANRYRGRGIDYEDLFQAGCEGLVKACDRFDESRGLMFSTYAVPVILGEIRKLYRDGGAVKVSRRLKELSLKAARLQYEIEKQTGEEATLSELSRRLCCERQTLVEALCACAPVASLTQGEEDEERQADVGVDGGEERVNERMTLQQAMDGLDSFERELISQRYFCGKTQAQTAQCLGTTQVQVSRKERKTLQKLRQLME